MKVITAAEEVAASERCQAVPGRMPKKRAQHRRCKQLSSGDTVTLQAGRLFKACVDASDIHAAPG
jgi:hypothetical protein